MDDETTVVELQEKRVVCKNLVDMLEDVISDAKEGIIVAAGVVVVHCDATTGSAFAGGNPGQLLFESLVMQRDLMDCEVDLRMHEAGTKY